MSRNLAFLAFCVIATCGIVTLGLGCSKPHPVAQVLRRRRVVRIPTQPPQAT